MKILILGGTGAMGKELVQILSESGHELIITSRREINSELDNIKYVKGNACDDMFLKSLLSEDRYDVIVDFMNYKTSAFNKRIESLLIATNQYLFLSSARVFADSKEPITEESDRLLDVCEDQEYLKSDEYALAKARQEDLLHSSGKTNWTIIRPYITYGDNRLQLGFMEKELWLYRALSGRTIVMGDDICKRDTTLTSGKDVALALSKIIGNKNALGQTYNVMQTESIKWSEVLKVYIDTLKEITGKDYKVLFQDSSNEIGKVSGRLEQITYDRLYDRTFNNSKISKICPYILEVVPTKKGLHDSLCSFLEGKRSFRDIDWRAEGYMDKRTHEFCRISEINGIKNVLKYLIARITPYFEWRRDS